ncbi:MAG: hypothetical protein AAFR72_07800, partial [Pseudomonadota bacterium]
MAINRPAQRFVKNIAEPNTRMQWPKALCVAGAMGTLLMSPMVIAQEPSPTKPIPATHSALGHCMRVFGSAIFFTNL